MVLRGKQSQEMSIAQVFSPLRSLPQVQGDLTLSTSSAVLFADATDTSGYGARRIRIYNTDSSITIGLFFIEAGATATGLTIANSMKLAAGATFESVISTGMRVAAVAASGSPVVNRLVHDLL